MRAVIDLPAEGPSIFGFEEGQTPIALAVVLGEALIFRVVQVIALKTMNKIER